MIAWEPSISANAQRANQNMLRAAARGSVAASGRASSRQAAAVSASCAATCTGSRFALYLRASLLGLG